MHLSIVNAAAHAYRATIGINQRVNGLDGGREFATWYSIHGHLCFLTWLDFVLEAFGQTEVQQDCFNVFHIDHVGAVFQIITHVNLTQTCGAIKGGQHFQTL